MAAFRVNCELRRGERLEQRLPSFWTVHCIRRDDGWKINRIVRGDIGVEAFGASRSALDYVRRRCAEGAARLGR